MSKKAIPSVVTRTGLTTGGNFATEFLNARADHAAAADEWIRSLGRMDDILLQLSGCSRFSELSADRERPDDRVVRATASAWVKNHLVPIVRVLRQEGSLFDKNIRARLAEPVRDTYLPQRAAAEFIQRIILELFDDPSEKRAGDYEHQVGDVLVKEWDARVRILRFVDGIGYALFSIFEGLRHKPAPALMATQTVKENESPSQQSASAATGGSTELSRKAELAKADLRTELAAINATGRAIIRALWIALEKGQGRTLDQLVRETRMGTRSTVERGIKALETAGFEIPNAGNGAGYSLRGRILLIAQEMVRIDAE